MKNNSVAGQMPERATQKINSCEIPLAYLKMRVLGAIDMAEGNSIQSRIQAVSQMTFTDEDGHPRQFTWRTIQTWFSRYQKHGVTVMENQPRSDKGKVRKVVHRRRAGSHPQGSAQSPRQNADAGLALSPVHRSRVC